MKRLILVRHAPTGATREARFPRDECIEERERGDAERLRDSIPGHADALTSPARCCLETAEAAGLGATVEPALADLDVGTWAGLTLEDVHERDPIAVAEWMEDPGAVPHGGESLRELSGRVADWLDAVATGGGWTVAITHAGVVRAAVVSALGAPIEAWWRIDVSPLSLTELHHRGGRWSVRQVNYRPGGGR